MICLISIQSTCFFFWGFQQFQSRNVFRQFSRIPTAAKDFTFLSFIVTGRYQRQNSNICVCMLCSLTDSQYTNYNKALQLAYSCYEVHNIHFSCTNITCILCSIRKNVQAAGISSVQKCSGCRKNVQAAKISLILPPKSLDCRH